MFNDIALHNFSHWNELAATIFEEYTFWPAYWDHWLSVGHEFWNCKHPLLLGVRASPLLATMMSPWKQALKSEDHVG